MNEALEQRATRERSRNSVTELSSRARDVVAAARDVLEAEGPEAVTMRRIADELGIRAPSLYKHVPHKAALEVAIVIAGFEEVSAAFEAAVDGADDPLGAFVGAYRSFASRTSARLPADDPAAAAARPASRRSGGQDCRPARGGGRQPGTCPGGLGVHPWDDRARARRALSLR